MSASNFTVEQVLLAARKKLEIYRRLHGGEYVGGMEYTALIAEIDNAVRELSSKMVSGPPPRRKAPAGSPY